MSLERGNEEVEIPNDGGVDWEQPVILLALFKEDAVDQSIIGHQTNQQIDFKTGSDFFGRMWKWYWHLIGQKNNIEASSEFVIGKRKWRSRNTKWWRGGLRAASDFISIIQRRCRWIR